LYLGDNQITDVKPLAELTLLTELNLWNNQIKNIESLSNLENLSYLGLQDNPIENKICPIEPTSVCQF
jgi:internalin A